MQAQEGYHGRSRPARARCVVAGSELIFPVRRLAPYDLKAWAQVLERGYEGYVAKDDASAYEGGATRLWLKIKRKASGGGTLLSRGMTRRFATCCSDSRAC